MMNAAITFNDKTELAVEKNGDCYILEEKPDFPADLSVVTVESEEETRVYRNAFLIEF